MRFYFVSAAALYIGLTEIEKSLHSFLNSFLPQNWVKYVRFCLTIGVSFLLSKLVFALGYLWMIDDLTRAVYQFYPAASGGMSGDAIPPTPPPHSDSTILVGGDTPRHAENYPLERPPATQIDEIDKINKQQLEERILENNKISCEELKEEILKSKSFEEECQKWESIYPEVSRETVLERVIKEGLGKKVWE